jgi:hypothetical protein
MENLFLSIISPLKMELFHPIRMPPEFPTEGEKANLLKRFGGSFLIKVWSKWSLLVS